MVLFRRLFSSLRLEKQGNDCLVSMVVCWKNISSSLWLFRLNDVIVDIVCAVLRTLHLTKMGANFASVCANLRSGMFSLLSSPANSSNEKVP